MPISSSAASNEKKRAFRIRGKTAAASVDISDKETSHKTFLTIGPALPNHLIHGAQRKVLKRSLSNLSAPNSCFTFDNESTDAPAILQTYPDGIVHISRTQKAKEKNPGRICLDRRGLSAIPIVDGETQLRLLSLQHNLVNKLDGLQEQGFSFLVFLDVYDNQLEKISSLDSLENLRVLLMGKNRIKKIEGLQCITKLEVLDLHGNLITQIGGLSDLKELKVLNLAGNQIKTIGMSDLKGLICLQELNLRRNRLKKLLGFGDVLQLQKLFISNNEIQTVEDMSSMAKAINLREVTIDNNPVSTGGECVSFLVSYLPQLMLLSNMQITEQVRKAAMTWRRNKETSNAAFMDLTSDVCLNVHREEIISNARTNWELIRSQTKCITMKNSNPIYKDFKINSDFVLTPICKPEIKSNLVKKRVSTARISVLPDKKITMIRSSSQETENSQNTSSSSNSNEQFFRLPPILVPIINRMESSTNNAQTIKKWGSLTSLGPNVDSSSYPSTSDTSSESETESEHKNEIKPIALQSPFDKKAMITINNDTASNISNTSNLQSSSTSGSELNSDKSTRINSRASKRSIKSAISQKSTTMKPTNRAATAKIKPRDPSPPVLETNKDREQGGDYLIEICGRYLNIYGQAALRFIDKAWNPVKANDVHFIKFNYVHFNGLVGVFSKIKNRFPNVDGLIFTETNISFLGQLNALAEVQGFESLQIDEEGNSIYKKNWRSYAVFRLSHWGLKMINGIEITDEEVANANEEYQSLSDLVLWSLPDLLLQPLLARLQLDIDCSNSEASAKKWLMSADPALRSVVSKEALQWRRGSVSQEDTIWRQKGKTHISTMLDEVTTTVHKLRLLDQTWPSVLKNILNDILTDYSQLDTYMKKKLHELNST